MLLAQNKSPLCLTPPFFGCIIGYKDADGVFVVGGSIKKIALRYGLVRGFLLPGADCFLHRQIYRFLGAENKNSPSVKTGLTTPTPCVLLSLRGVSLMMSKKNYSKKKHLSKISRAPGFVLRILGQIDGKKGANVVIMQTEKYRSLRREAELTEDRYLLEVKHDLHTEAARLMAAIFEGSRLISEYEAETATTALECYDKEYSQHKIAAIENGVSDARKRLFEIFNEITELNKYSTVRRKSLREHTIRILNEYLRGVYSALQENLDISPEDEPPAEEVTATEFENSIYRIAECK